MSIFATPDIEMERRDDGALILRSRVELTEWEPSITAVLRKPFDLHTLTHAIEQAMLQMGAASPWPAEDSTVAS